MNTIKSRVGGLTEESLAEAFTELGPSAPDAVVIVEVGSEPMRLAAARLLRSTDGVRIAGDLGFDEWRVVQQDTLQGATQYTTRVPERVRFRTKAALDSWIADGRQDDRIEQLVRTLVLGAYCDGCDDTIKAEVDRKTEETLGDALARHLPPDLERAVRAWLELEKRIAEDSEDSAPVPMFDVRLDATHNRDDAREYRLFVTAGPWGFAAADLTDVLSLADDLGFGVVLQNAGVELR